MNAIQQEIMTPREAARWFRRSQSWLRQQRDLLRVSGPRGQALYHTGVCRAYMLGQLCGLEGDKLRRVQIQALSADCGNPPLVVRRATRHTASPRRRH